MGMHRHGKSARTTLGENGGGNGENSFSPNQKHHFHQFRLRPNFKHNRHFHIIFTSFSHHFHFVFTSCSPHFHRRFHRHFHRHFHRAFSHSHRHSHRRFHWTPCCLGGARGSSGPRWGYSGTRAPSAGAAVGFKGACSRPPSATHIWQFAHLCQFSSLTNFRSS